MDNTQCSTNGSCSTDKGSCCTTSDKCCGGQGHIAMLMGTTMCAKKGLMADKIRSRLEAKYGKQMDEAADLAVELLAKKMEQQEDCSAGLEEAEQKLKDIFKQG